jgi:hypothetical protein
MSKHTYICFNQGKITQVGNRGGKIFKLGDSVAMESDPGLRIGQVKKFRQYDESINYITAKIRTNRKIFPESFFTEIDVDKLVLHRERGLDPILFYLSIVLHE